jgi:hypothetical protein
MKNAGMTRDSELRWAAAVNRLRLNVSRIIPGNWGKVRSGWLARLLSSWIARFGGGGRIHQFLWRRSRAVSNAKRD